MRGSLDRIGASWPRIVPELGPAPDAEAPGSSLSTLGQTRLFERLVDVLRGAATIAPVVVELEDIHWADQSSQAFLLYLVEAARGAHLLLLCTYRPEAADTSGAFRTTLGQLLRRQGVATMPLMPFDAEELRQQLTGILGRPPSTALLNAIRARSEGNPLFTEELAAARDPNVDLPASIGAATAARVGTLSPNARSVLRVASVVGRTATYDVLREVTSLSDDDLADALREAVQVRLIEPIHDREAYRFRHALLQEAIYRETLPGERRRLHAAVANALWDDPDRPPDDADLAPRLARHWLEARRVPPGVSCVTGELPPPRSSRPPTPRRRPIASVSSSCGIAPARRPLACSAPPRSSTPHGWRSWPGRWSCRWSMAKRRWRSSRRRRTSASRSGSLIDWRGHSADSGKTTSPRCEASPPSIPRAGRCTIGS